MSIRTVLLAALVSLAPLSAHAIPVTYTFEGSASFAITDATGQTTQYSSTNNEKNFSVTMQGDTGNVASFSSNKLANDGLIANFDTQGFNANLSDTVYVFSWINGFDIVGFGNSTNGDLLDIWHVGLGNYDLVTNIAFDESNPNAFLPNGQWNNVAYNGGGSISMLSLAWTRFSTQVQNNNPGNPVPEPATLAMLAIGLTGLAAARRKR